MSRVIILVFDGFQILDATGPAAAFEIAGRYGVHYSLAFAGVDQRTTSSGGTTIETLPVREVDSFDTLIVAGGDRFREAVQTTELVEFIANAARTGRRVASVCSGAFLLAAAGLLDSRRAATHWSTVAELKRCYPNVIVDPESIFVEDRGIWTSAGVAAGIDLSLGIIGRDHGEDIARSVAQHMVVYHRRPGTQSQHSAMLELVTPDNRFAPLLTWARARLAERLDVTRLAEQSALSVRQFTRAFTTATGVPPAKAIERLRVEAARTMIEAGATSLEMVARRTGFSNADRMRRAFVKITGQPPLEVRRSASRYAKSAQANVAA